VGQVEEVVERVPPRRRPSLAPWLLAALGFALAIAAVAWALYEHFKGPDTKKVPQLVGLQDTVARQRLVKRGFKVRFDGETSRFPAGRVLKQAPQGGVRLEVGGRVGVSYSLGPPVVAVPRLLGLRTAAAVRLVRSLGLRQFHQVVPSARSPGLVVSQNPTAGVKVAKGSTVNFLVSQGPQLIIVPAVRGFTVRKAVRTLTRVGLVPVVVRVQSAEPIGVVVAQNPPSGAKVRRGARVRINVSGVETPTTGTTTGTTTTTP
jgi:serine/threonine-protein kinase